MPEDLKTENDLLKKLALDRQRAWREYLNRRDDYERATDSLNELKKRLPEYEIQQQAKTAMEEAARYHENLMSEDTPLLPGLS